MTAVHVVMPLRPGDDQRTRNAAVTARWWTDLGLRPNLCDDPNPDDFNRGRALNAGVEELGANLGDVLILTDGDLLPTEAAIEQAIGAVVARTAPGFVVPFTEVRYLNEAATDAAHRGTLLPDLTEGVWDRPSTGGINIMRVSTFERCHGFDPRFTGWGFEDAAFDIAAHALAGPTRWMPGHVLHLWHPPGRNPEAPSYDAGLVLCRRYEAAAGDEAAVRELIRERSR